MPTREFFNHAISRHARWKLLLRTAIDHGRCEHTSKEVWMDDRCEFGRWVHSLPMSERDPRFYDEAKELHATFHHEASRILDLALKGNRDEAEQMLNPFMHCSSKLVHLLARWRDEQNA